MKKETKIQVLGNLLIYLSVAGILFTFILISLLIPKLEQFTNEKLYWVFLMLLTSGVALYLKKLIDRYAD